MPNATLFYTIFDADFQKNATSKPCPARWLFAAPNAGVIFIVWL